MLSPLYSLSLCPCMKMVLESLRAVSVDVLHTATQMCVSSQLETGLTGQFRVVVVELNTENM